MIDLDLAIAAVIAITMAMSYSSMQYLTADNMAGRINDLKMEMQLVEKSNEMLETCEFVQCSDKLAKSHAILERTEFKKGQCISRLALHNGVETAVQACI